MERINILWTGGFDSTFRVCQLSLLNIEIQPFYIREKRKSEPNELKAITDITDYIRSNKVSKCNLLPLYIINHTDIIPDKQISDSFNVLHKEFGIGTQYDLLARFARQNDLILEVGFESDPTGRVDACFAKYGVIKEAALPVSGGGIIEYCEVDLNESSEDFTNVFGHFQFGLPLFKMTKLQTIKAYEVIGFQKVIPMTWFCAHPLNGKPCGLCSPCEAAMKASLGFRLPFRARMRYKIFKTNPVGRSIDNKFKALYNKHWRN